MGLQGPQYHPQYLVLQPQGRRLAVPRQAAALLWAALRLLHHQPCLLQVPVVLLSLFSSLNAQI